MKKNIAVLALGFILASGFAVAGENMDMAPYEGSAAFQQMKDLDGVWEGVHPAGDTEEAITVEYDVMSNGHVVMEHLFPGTQHSMISTYYDKAGQLHMTHYCSIGNRPLMALIKADENKLFFALSPDSDINPGDPHMHSLVITFVDEDHITHEWGYYQDGKPAAEKTRFEFTRIE